MTRLTWVRGPDGVRGQAGHIFVQMIRQGLKPGYVIEEEDEWTWKPDDPLTAPLVPPVPSDG